MGCPIAPLADGTYGESARNPCQSGRTGPRSRTVSQLADALVDAILTMIAFTGDYTIGPVPHAAAPCTCHAGELHNRIDLAPRAITALP